MWLNLILLFLCANVWAADPPMQLYNEGVKQGVIFNIDCVGAGITCSKSNTTGTLSVSGGGGGGSGTVNSGTANQVGYYATTGTEISGSNNFVFDGTNVGVGTITPTAKLHVLQTAAANAFQVDDQAADTTPFIINSAGNVGIQDSSPAGSLEVGGNIVATPSGLSAVSNFSSYHRLTRSTEGNADGTSVPQGFEGGLILTGANNVSQGQGAYLHTTNSLTSGTVATHIAQLNYTNLTSGGNSTNVTNVFALPVLSGAGNITGSQNYFSAGAPSVSSTGDITGAIYGFKAANIGRSSATTVTSFSAADVTKGSGNAIAYEGLVGAGSGGKYNLYMSGSAPNYFVGNIGVGTIAPVALTEITQTAAVDAFRVNDQASDTTPFVITSDGNVGVGSPLPVNKLNVVTAGGTTGLANTESTANLFVDNGVVGTALGLNNSNIPIIQGIVNSTNAARSILFNPYGGNIGIGTSQLPTGILQVKSTDSAGIILVSGTTNGIRIGTSSTDTNVTGVDNTGFATYQPLAVGGSKLAFTISGVEKMTVDSTGNVGVGTVNPTALLAVTQTAAVDSFRVDDAAGDTSPFIIDSTGNVGIGTSLPSNLLEVGARKFKVSSTGDITLLGSSILSNVSNIKLDFSPNASSAANQKFFRLGSGTTSVASSGDARIVTTEPTINQSGTAGYTALNISVIESATGSGERNLISADVGGTNRFIVKSDGNVGIGTALPQPTLAGRKALEITDTVSGAELILTGPSSVRGAMKATSSVVTFGSLSSNGLQIQTNNTGRVFVNGADGNVGIGSATPGKVLDVVGDVRATNLQATSISGSTQCVQADTNGNLSGTGSSCGGSGAPGGSNTEVQYNSSGSFAGSSSFVFNGTNVGIGTSNPVVRLQLGNVVSTSNTSNLTIKSTTTGAGIGVSESGGNILYTGISSTNGLIGTEGAGNLPLIFKAGSNAGQIVFNGGNPRWTLGNTGTAGSTVSISKNVSVGSSFYTLAAPSDGLIVEGNVGIGSSAPGVKLDIQGSVRVSTGTAGQAVCWKADKTLGQCTTVIDVTGGCTCS